MIDELERLGDAPDALAVIGAVVRYAPPRHARGDHQSGEVVIDAGTAATLGRVAALGEADLAFTAGEAAHALADLGRGGDRPASRPSRRPAAGSPACCSRPGARPDHVAGLGGEADPLHGYLSSQILEQLDPADREFLVATSLLEEVTPARAEALGAGRCGERLASLRAEHLPVTWEPTGGACAATRAYASTCSSAWSGGDRRRPRAAAAHGALLAREGHHEDAAEEFLRAGSPGRARVTAERVIPGVIERLDLAVAERWLDALADAAPSGAR